MSIYQRKMRNTFFLNRSKFFFGPLQYILGLLTKAHAIKLSLILPQISKLRKWRKVLFLTKNFDNFFWPFINK